MPAEPGPHSEEWHLTEEERRFGIKCRNAKSIVTNVRQNRGQNGGVSEFQPFLILRKTCQLVLQKSNCPGWRQEFRLFRNDLIRRGKLEGILHQFERSGLLQMVPQAENGQFVVRHLKQEAFLRIREWRLRETPSLFLD